MKSLITGGTGFIGSRLALRLLEAGNEVSVLGQVNNSAEEENLVEIKEAGADVIIASITDVGVVTEATSGIDYVFHLAAAQHEMNVPDQLFWDVNVEGTKNLLNASLAAGVKRFIHGSTIGVYDPDLRGTIDEQSPLRPDNIYGITKLEAEKVVTSFQEKLPVVIIRISETYGPGDRRLLKLFRGIKSGMFFVIGAGKNIHHLLYIDDLVEGLIRAGREDDVTGRIITLSGKEPLSTNAMVRTIAQELGVNPPRWRAPMSLFMLMAVIMESTLRPLGIQPPLHRRRMDFFRKSFQFSQKRSTEILGFSPQTGFRQGVSETARWYMDKGHL